jgi:DNA-binding GntR family transcriptional regulator
MAAYRVERVRKTTLIDQVVDTLRQSIVSGQVAPGTHLREVELAEQLGVSRASLRESLVRLEAEGLVESFPGRGSRVCHLSTQDVEELFALRFVLEKEAVRLAIDRITPDQIEYLELLNEDEVQAVAERDVAELSRINREFHTAVAEIAGNRRLKELLETLYTQVQMYVGAGLHAGDQDFYRLAAAHHRHLTEAIRASDKQKAAALLESHLEAGLVALKPFLSEPDEEQRSSPREQYDVERS